MSSQPPIKVLAFDFFGVLSSEVAPPWFERYFLHDQATDMRQSFMRPADKGNVSTEDTFAALAKLINTTSENVERDWYALSKINKDVLAFIEEYRSEYKVVLCSNAMSLYIRNILQAHNLEQLFDEIFISSEMHEMKPEAAYFNKVLDTLEVKADEVLFLDDTLINIVAANALGFRAVQFKGAQTLENVRQILSK